MRRARHPLPLQLKGLRYNVEMEKYIIVENKILYGIPFELLDNLKRFHKKYTSTFSFLYWYNSLTKEERRKVVTESKKPLNREENFYPDISYPD